MLILHFFHTLERHLKRRQMLSDVIFRAHIKVEGRKIFLYEMRIKQTLTGHHPWEKDLLNAEILPIVSLINCRSCCTDENTAIFSSPFSLMHPNGCSL